MQVSKMEIAMVIKQRAKQYHSCGIVQGYAAALDLYAMSSKEMHLYPANWKCCIAKHGLNGYEVLQYEGH